MTEDDLSKIIRDMAVFHGLEIDINKLPDAFDYHSYVSRLRKPEIPDTDENFVLN